MGPSMVLSQCLGKTASVARRCYLALEDERGTVGELFTAPKMHRELHRLSSPVFVSLRVDACKTSCVSMHGNNGFQQQEFCLFQDGLKSPSPGQWLRPVLSLTLRLDSDYLLVCLSLTHFPPRVP